MQRLRKSKSFWAIMLVGMVMLSFTVMLHAARMEPYNKIVIIIDSSGSYSSSHLKAINKTIELLNALSRARAHRWETAPDRVVVISLDALPEALWSGTSRELKEKDPSFWTARFNSRTDYALCTDVGAAFRLAARHLKGDPRYVRRFMYVFSDLRDEPPGDSIYKPRKRSNAPPDGMPWQELHDVSVSVFWLPPNQKLIWSRAIEEHGLSDSFALYTDSESSSVVIQAPSKPTLEYTEAQRRAARERYTGYALRFAMGVAIFFIAAALLLVATVVLLRRGSNGRLTRLFGSGQHPPGSRDTETHGPQRAPVPFIPGSGGSAGDRPRS